MINLVYGLLERGFGLAYGLLTGGAGPVDNNPYIVVKHVILPRSTILTTNGIVPTNRIHPTT